MKELKNTASFIDVTGLTKSTGVNARKEKQIVMQLKSMFLVGIQSKWLGDTFTILNIKQKLSLFLLSHYHALITCEVSAPVCFTQVLLTLQTHQ